jgi:hypothetical protein
MIKQDPAKTKSFAGLQPKTGFSSRDYFLF